MSGGDEEANRPSAVLAEATNPFGNLVAVLEDDGRTVYLYVHHVEQREWGMRALWVANRLPAPDGVDAQARLAGMAPLMPRAATRHPGGMPALRAEAVELVWTEEGDGVAVLYEGALLAARVPALARLPDATSDAPPFPGFAREAIGATPWAWEMTEDARIAVDARIAAARATFARWATDKAWRGVQDAGLAHLERCLGKHAQYFAVGGERFPPLGLARFAPPALPGVSVYATVGMSAFPMPQIERDVRDPGAHRRIEVVVAVERAESDAANVVGGPAGGEPAWPTSVLAWLARFPWTSYTWLGEGHTVLAPTAHATWFPPDQSAIFLTSTPPHDGVRVPPALGGLVAPVAEGATVAADPVTYLYAVPITMDERKIAQLLGAAGLLERLPERGKSFVFRE